MIRNNSIIYKFIAECDNVNLKDCHLEFKAHLLESCNIYYQTNNILIKGNIIYVVCPWKIAEERNKIEFRIWKSNEEFTLSEIERNM